MEMKTFRLIFFLSSLAVSCFSSEENATGDETSPNDTRRILVFGGNGFIGSEVVRRLLARKYEVTTVNRGNQYFDSEKRIAPFIKENYKCDRDKSLRRECAQLVHSGKYDVVIDFSAYNPEHLQEAIGLLKLRVGLYIYVSTDSVYEVCEKRHDGPTKEEDAIRPQSARKRAKLKKDELYGHNKLACEEVLREQRKSGGFPYTILRLPDVIGPRDNSLRFWMYQLWIRVHEAIEHPVHLPSGVANVPFSLVHVEDVAKAVEGVLDVGEKAHDQVFNLGFEEHLTLDTFLNDLAAKLGVKDLQFHHDDKTSWHTYPTVTKGPLNITKARTLLNWEPMTWQGALSSLCDFFDDAMTNEELSEEKEMLLGEFLEYTVPDTHFEAFLGKLKEIYGDAVFDGMDFDWGVDSGVPEIEAAANRNEAEDSAETYGDDVTRSEEIDYEQSLGDSEAENQEDSTGEQDSDSKISDELWFFFSKTYLSALIDDYETDFSLFGLWIAIRAPEIPSGVLSRRSTAPPRLIHHICNVKCVNEAPCSDCAVSFAYLA